MKVKKANKYILKKLGLRPAALAFKIHRPGQKPPQAKHRAWLGLAFFGLARPGLQPQARAGTSLEMSLYQVYSGCLMFSGGQIRCQPKCQRSVGYQTVMQDQIRYDCIQKYLAIFHPTILEGLPLDHQVCSFRISFPLNLSPSPHLQDWHFFFSQKLMFAVLLHEYHQFTIMGFRGVSWRVWLAGLRVTK